MDDSGPIVEPAVPAFLRRARRAATAAPRGSTWPAGSIARPSANGSRVFVNRLWYLFFGNGLADSLDD